MEYKKYPYMNTYQILGEVDQIMKHHHWWRPYSGDNREKALFFYRIGINLFGRRKKTRKK